jgi:hypothetical protein
VPACAPSKDPAQRASEIVFTLFGFHCCFRMSETVADHRALTTKQSWDFAVPLLGEQRRVACRALDGYVFTGLIAPPRLLELR